MKSDLTPEEREALDVISECVREQLPKIVRAPRHPLLTGFVLVCSMMDADDPSPDSEWWHHAWMPGMPATSQLGLLDLVRHELIKAALYPAEFDDE